MLGAHGILPRNLRKDISFTTRKENNTSKPTILKGPGENTGADVTGS